MVCLGGKRLLNHEFLDRRLSGEDGILNKEVLKKMFGLRAFYLCRELRTVNISISWALFERMERLPSECRVSVAERICELPRLELNDGSVFACFPVVKGASVNQYQACDANLETARSLYRLLQLIAFHELRESSIVIELAMWKSSINVDRARTDCRVPIPDPAKSLIMEYCGFADFLEHSIEGSRDMSF